MDDQGYGDVGYTSDSSDISTPLMDKLAREGLILSRHYTAWACTPTRASIMTGRYPITLGIQHDVFQPNTMECLNEKELLLPEVLRHNGYATHLVGKWHLGYARWSCMPCMRGFDSAYGYINGKMGYYNHIAGGYYDFYKCAYSHKYGLTWDVLTEDKDIYSVYLYNKRVKKLVEEHDPEKPLFLYLSMQSVHNPYEVPERYYKCHNSARCTMQAMLSAAEDLLSDVISYYKAAGMWENTILVFHSDNGAPHTGKGYTSNGILRGWKGHLWEGGVRTVAFLYSESDALLKRRGETDCYVHVSDWYSTIVSMSGGWNKYESNTGLQKPSDLDSIDQWDYFTSSEEEDSCRRTEIMLHIDPVKRVAAYYKGRFKLLLGPQQDDSKCLTDAAYPLDIGSINLKIKQLFDVYSDPGEEHNIASGNPDIVQELLDDVIEYVSHQNPLQCQLPTIADSYPNSTVPYYLPWDWAGDEEMPETAYTYKFGSYGF